MEVLTAKQISTTLNESDFNELRVIAQKCYDSLGIATLDARAMLPILEHISMIDDGEKGHICNAPRSIEKANLNTGESIILYPNPNLGDFIHLGISKYGKDFDGFEIYDAFGRSQIAHKINPDFGADQDILINISNLSSGWFTLQLYDKDDKFGSINKRFFITR